MNTVKAKFSQWHSLKYIIAFLMLHNKKYQGHKLCFIMQIH